MSIEKIASTLVSTVSQAAKKVNVFAKGPSIDISKATKKVSSSLDCMASYNKITVPDKKASASEVAHTCQKIIKEPITLKGLAQESLKSGSTPKEAVNGAKALMSAITKPTGKSAYESAIVFNRAGLNNLEKKLAQQERKLNLQQKYGKALEELKNQKELEKLLKEN